MINPAFHDFPEEGRIVGLLVISYSELDLTLCHVGGLALGSPWSVLQALHEIPNESTRINVVKSLVRHIFEEQGLGAQFGEAIGAISYCRKMRNQYAHAYWKPELGRLWFTNPRDYKWTPDQDNSWGATNLAILQSQESYFEYARKCLMWFEMRIREPRIALTWPAHMQRPPLQDLAAQHNNRAPKQDKA